MTTSSASPRGVRPRRQALALAALLAALAALLVPAASEAAEPAPPGFFGVTESLMSPDDFRMMREADSTTFRTIFPISGAKSSRNGEYDWTHMDSYVRMSAYLGIQLQPVLYGSPPWISKERSAVPLKGEAAAEWHEYLSAVVKRYGENGDFWNDYYEGYTPYRPITVWQVWNEPNSITWWAPRPNPTQYAKFFARSADTIKAVDPTARVMTAGIVAKPTNKHAIPGKKFIKRVLAVRAAREQVDILGFHPFSPSIPGVRKQIVSARKALNRAGLRSTPIWITEIGWGSKGPKSLELVKSPKGQERALKSTFQMAIKERERLGIEKLLWYHWRDYRDDLCRWCETSGLVTKKLKKKPIYDIFRDLATP